MPNGRTRALIRRAGRRPICKTHRTLALAKVWARGIEAALDAGEPVEQAVVTVGQLIAAYRTLRDASRPIADDSTAHYTLKALTRLLGDVDAHRLKTDDLVAYCTQRRDEGAGPYTLNMDLSQLSTALRYAASAKGLTLPDAVGHARPLLKHLGMIGDGGKRERRPTRDELDRIVERLGVHRGAVYADAVRFAVASAMRAGEICRIAWADVDLDRRVVVIRDRKDPRNKKGNHQTVPLLPAAWAIVLEQPRGDRIFPIDEGTLSKYFTETCRELAIPDLHLHDMRHEGTSQLFEAGYDIPEVALVTGHKKWDSLRRYTQLKPDALHR